MNNWQKLRKRKLEAPPTLLETTSNLQSPEVIGEKVDKRTLRKTGRTEQFATRVSKEWLERIKETASKENLKLVEVLEKSLQTYQQKYSDLNEITTLRQTLKNIEKQVQPLQSTMSWKEVESKLGKLKPTLFQQAGLPITYEVLKETLQEFSRLDKERNNRNNK